MINKDVLSLITNEILKKDDLNLAKLKDEILTHMLSEINDLKDEEYPKFLKILDYYIKNRYTYSEKSGANNKKIEKVNHVKINSLLMEIKNNMPITEYIKTIYLLTEGVNSKNKTFTEVLPKHIENMFNEISKSKVNFSNNEDSILDYINEITRVHFYNIDINNIIYNLYTTTNINNKAIANRILRFIEQTNFRFLSSYCINKNIDHLLLLEIRKDYSSYAGANSPFKLLNGLDLGNTQYHQLYRYVDDRSKFYDIINSNDFKQMYNSNLNYFDSANLLKLDKYFPKNIDNIAEIAVLKETKIKSIESRIKFYEKKDGSLFIKPEMLLRDLYLVGATGDVPEDLTIDKLKSLYIEYIEYYNTEFTDIYNTIPEEDLLVLNKLYKNKIVNDNIGKYSFDYTLNLTADQNFAFFYKIKSEYIKKEMVPLIEYLNIVEKSKINENER